VFPHVFYRCGSVRGETEVILGCGAARRVGLRRFTRENGHSPVPFLGGRCAPADLDGKLREYSSRALPT
jgi:hypothetical protein